MKSPAPITRISDSDTCATINADARRPCDWATRPVLATAPGEVLEARQAGTSPKISVVATAMATVTPNTRQFAATSSAATDASGPTRRAVITCAMASLPNQAIHTPTAVPATASSAPSEEHTSELQSRLHLVCRLLLEKKKQ